MKDPKFDSSWRDSARSPKLWIFDARASFPLLIFLFYISWASFIFVVIAMSFFSLLNKYGFSVPIFARWLRSSLAGKRKSARPFWK